MSPKGLQPKHDSHNSSTQDSAPKPSSAGKRYTNGANVMKGPGGKPSEPGPASQPKQDGY